MSKLRGIYKRLVYTAVTLLSYISLIKSWDYLSTMKKNCGLLKITNLLPTTLSMLLIKKS